MPLLKTTSCWYRVGADPMGLLPLSKVKLDIDPGRTPRGQSPCVYREPHVCQQPPEEERPGPLLLRPCRASTLSSCCWPPELRASGVLLSKMQPVSWRPGTHTALSRQPDTGRPPSGLLPTTKCQAGSLLAGASVPQTRRGLPMASKQKMKRLLNVK
jgi:hypothetical protein